MPEEKTDFGSKAKTRQVNRSKYGAVRDGSFRSKIESAVSKILQEKEIDYCYECESVTLIPKFEFEDKKYRELKYIPDFVIMLNNVKYYLEIKGFETPEFKLKWKLLHYYLSLNPMDGKFVIIKSLKELKEFINEPTANRIKPGKKNKKSSKGNEANNVCSEEQEQIYVQ